MTGGLLAVPVSAQGVKQSTACGVTSQEQSLGVTRVHQGPPEPQHSALPSLVCQESLEMTRPTQFKGLETCLGITKNV